MCWKHTKLYFGNSCMKTEKVDPKQMHLEGFVEIGYHLHLESVTHMKKELARL